VRSIGRDGNRHGGRSASRKGILEYADLLWACRGAGGGNFGINTSFEFQTFPVSRLTAYELWWDVEPEAIFAGLVGALEDAPTTLGCKVSAARLRGNHRVRVQLLGQLFGKPAQLREILQPVYAIAPPSEVAFLEELSYWDAQDKLSEVGEPGYYQERSRFFNQAFSASDVGTIFAWLRRWPATVKAASFKVFQTGGRVNAVAPKATAFVHRKSRWLSSIDLKWDAASSSTELQRNLAWQSDFYDAIVPLARGGAYQNFTDPSLADWKNAYYGVNLPRLETLKDRVDPTHLFDFPEAIP
jgi:FAD/FMN-containing dehydrogenase